MRNYPWGKPSSKEVKLTNELKSEKKNNRKFALAPENAEHRVQLEKELNKKLKRKSLI